MNRRGSPLLVLVATSAVLAAGCGEKSEPPTSGPVVTQTTGATTSTSTTGGTTTQTKSDDEQIAAAVAGFLTKPNPSVCDELITPAFLKRSYGDRQGCVAARKPSALAKAVKIEPLPSGQGTMVTATPTGGVFDGQKLKVTLINLDGQWTIDKITSNVPVGP